jgi:hypothetical protein
MSPAWASGEVPEGVDPLVHFRLVEMAAFHDLPPDEAAWWSVQVALARDLGPEALYDGLAGLVACARSEGAEIVRLPQLYAVRDRALGPCRTLTLFARQAFVERLFRERAALGIGHILLGRIVPPEVRYRGGDAPAPRDIAAERPDLGAVPGDAPAELPVVVAVIDDGFGLAHEAFRRADGGSRIEYAWLQDGMPPNMPIGRELDRCEIERLLNAHTQGGRLDETGFYRAAGLADFASGLHKPVAFRTSHGTHVAALAGGYPPGEKDEARPLIFVQLSGQVVEDTGGGRIEPELGIAIDYVLDRARRISAARRLGVELPVAINFSFGNFAGSHDGTDLVESLLDDLVADGNASGASPGPVRVVLPAGNGKLARCHARFDFGTGSDAGVWRELDWHVLPDDRTASYAEIWLPLRPDGEPPSRELDLELVAPDGRTRVGLAAEDAAAVRDLRLDGHPVARLSYRFVPAPTARGCFALALLPTAHPRARPLAPAGRWRIRLRNRGLGRTGAESVHLRIQRDDSLANRPVRGRQSFFDDAGYRRFDGTGAVLSADPPNHDSPVTRAGTLSAFATGRRSFVVGGCVRSTGGTAAYSGAGPSQPNAAPNDPGPRAGPDTGAPSEDSPVLPGILGAGSRGGSRVRLNGTSVAAPQVARWVADALAARRAPDRAALSSEAPPDRFGCPTERGCGS